jgi:basic membrane lipoprotein Med (substrate-binding protein (PBP1-ABC) superfamily)
VEILETKYQPIYQRFNKPIVFTEVAYYSADGSATQQFGVYSSEISDFLPETVSVTSDWQEQADAYEAVLQAIAEKPWVQGTYSFGYSFMDHDCKGYSIRAKTAEEVLKSIYAQFNAAG